MALDYTKKTARRGIPFMDVAHAVIGIGIIVLFIIMVIDFDGNRKLLPFMMLAMAVLNIEETVYKIQHLPHGKKNLGGVFFSVGLTIVFLIIAAFMGIIFYR